MNEERRAQYAKRVSFQREFGSSIDPDMYENMDALEWELTGMPTCMLAWSSIRYYSSHFTQERRRSYAILHHRRTNWTMH